MSRRRLADASFGPEWRGFTGMGSWLWLWGPRDRDRHRTAKHLREARRELAESEKRWEQRMAGR